MKRIYVLLLVAASLLLSEVAWVFFFMDNSAMMQSWPRFSLSERRERTKPGILPRDFRGGTPPMGGNSAPVTNTVSAPTIMSTSSVAAESGQMGIIKSFDANTRTLALEVDGIGLVAVTLAPEAKIIENGKETGIESISAGRKALAMGELADPNEKSFTATFLELDPVTITLPDPHLGHAPETTDESPVSPDAN